MRRVNGEGSITRRRDGRWEGRYSFGWREGKRLRKSVYGRTQAEVMARLRELEARYNPDGDSLRLEDHMMLYLEEAKTWGRPQSFRSYNTWITKHIVPFLGSEIVGRMRPHDVREWLRGLTEKGVGATTRFRALTTLRSALQQLVDDGILHSNPCASVKGPKLEHRTAEIPERDAIGEILRAADPFWVFTLILLAFSCTLRQGEIFALWWSQVDLDKEELFVNKGLVEDWDRKLVRASPKTKASVRKIGLPKIMVQAFQKLKAEQELAGYTGDWVFPDTGGSPLRKSNFSRRIWGPLLKKAGLPHMRFHSTRHAGNALLIGGGRNAPCS